MLQRGSRLPIATKRLQPNGKGRGFKFLTRSQIMVFIPLARGRSPHSPCDGPEPRAQLASLQHHADVVDRAAFGRNQSQEFAAYLICMGAESSGRGLPVASSPVTAFGACLALLTMSPRVRCATLGIEILHLWCKCVSCEGRRDIQEWDRRGDTCIARPPSPPPRILAR